MKYVLFVCNHNAGRSQMAQAFFERHAPPDVRAESAGTSPARAVWPEVVAGDPTAHQLRLAQLLPSLATEFEQDHDPDEIRACADAILGRYDDAPVRSFVQSLALRQTRDCLRREHCDALLAG